MSEYVNFLISCGIKILLAFVAGFVLGLERKSRHQVVGMRTLILICESSAMLCVLSTVIHDNYTESDSARIAAGLISGIGFLGAGVIMKQGLNIKGLTSAAIILTDATIGLLIGEGIFIPAFALLVVGVMSLVLLDKVEEKFFPAVRTKSVHLKFRGTGIDTRGIKKILEKNGFFVTDLNVCQIISTDETILHFSVKTPKTTDYEEVVESVRLMGILEEFSVTD